MVFSWTILCPYRAGVALRQRPAGLLVATGTAPRSDTQVHTCCCTTAAVLLMIAHRSHHIIYCCCAVLLLCTKYVSKHFRYCCRSKVSSAGGYLCVCVCLLSSHYSITAVSSFYEYILYSLLQCTLYQVFCIQYRMFLCEIFFWYTSTNSR